MPGNEQLCAVLEEAIAGMAPAQQEAVRGRYWMEETVDNKAHNAALRSLRHPAADGVHAVEKCFPYVFPLPV